MLYCLVKCLKSQFLHLLMVGRRKVLSNFTETWLDFSSSRKKKKNLSSNDEIDDK